MQDISASLYSTHYFYSSFLKESGQAEQHEADCQVSSIYTFYSL